MNSPAEPPSIIDSLRDAANAAQVDLRAGERARQHIVEHGEIIVESAAFDGLEGIARQGAQHAAMRLSRLQHGRVEAGRKAAAEVVGSDRERQGEQGRAVRGIQGSAAGAPGIDGPQPFEDVRPDMGQAAQQTDDAAPHHRMPARGRW